MLASGLGALTALFLLQGSATAEAEAHLETRVGEFPTGVQGVQVMMTATPNLRFRWFSGFDSFMAEASSRILWRPIPKQHDRPLFLETLGLLHSARPSPRTQLNFVLRATYGEQDYTSLSREFTTQPTLPLARNMFMAEGNAGLIWRAARRTSLAFRLAGYHRRTLDSATSTTNGETSGTTFYVMPTQTMVSADPGLSYRLSPLSSMEVSVPVFYYDIQQTEGTTTQTEAPDILVVQPQLSVLDGQHRGHQLRLIAGLAYAHVVHGSSANLGSHFAPLGQADLDSDLYRTSTSSVRSSLRAGAAWFMDPVLGSGRLRGIAEAGLTAQIGRYSGAGTRVSFATDLTENSSANQAYNGTMVSVDASVRHRWPDLLVVELGGRFSERAPRLSSSDFAWRGRELWCFLSLYAAAAVSLTSLRPPTSPGGM